jgi:molybdopterin synthase catalytic subunit
MEWGELLVHWKWPEGYDFMRVQLLFFGGLKDLAGRDKETLDLPEDATVGDLLERCRTHMPDLQDYLGKIAVAVNQEYATRSLQLHEADEVALIPPVSGGADLPATAEPAIHTRITHDRIDAPGIAEALKHPDDGAVVVFEGIVRNQTRGRRTLYLDYEAYEGMAQKQLEDLARQALSRFAVRDVRVVHRLGRLEIGETSVAIVVASAHRAGAFEACRWLIDTLKRTVPIWKKEFFEDGAVWADGEPFPEEIRPQ